MNHHRLRVATGHLPSSGKGSTQARRPRMPNTTTESERDMAPETVAVADIVDVEAVECEAGDAAEPTCAQCSSPLTWRDAAYAAGTGLCKRCHQRSRRSRLVVALHPPVARVSRGGGKVEVVPVRANRAARRGHTHR